MKPEAGTKPRVYYRNLWRYSKCFIGGSVATEANGVVDCVEGASVRLLKDGTDGRRRATTDNYGDFKFDKLDENSGRYTIEVMRARPHQDARRQRSASASFSARSGCSFHLGDSPVATSLAVMGGWPRRPGADGA